MATVETIPAFGKKHKAGHAHAIGQAKHDRFARESLYNLFAFQETLEEEMRRMMAVTDKGTPLDKELFQKMMVVNENYAIVMRGFREFGDDQQRNALIVFADAVQDLMTYMHQHRRH